VLDVVGVLESVEPWSTISRRNGTETRKRAVYLRDDSGRSVELTLWGAFANNPGDALEAAVAQSAACAAAGQPPHPTVVAVKAARVGDFNGKNVSTIASSSVAIDPPRPEADDLRAWWTTRGGSSAPAVPLSERRGGGAGGGGGGGGGDRDRRVTLAAFAEEGFGTRGQPDYVNVLASVGFVRNSEGTRMTYAACTRDHGGRACNKKLQEQAGGGGAGGSDWWCERCQAPCADPAYRYLLSLQLADHTGATWVTAFGDTGDALMGGATAAQVREAQMAAEAERAGGEDGYGGAGGGGGGGNIMAGRQLEAIVEGATFRPHVLRLKAAVETWNDEARLKVSVVRATAPDWAQESRLLLSQIARLEQGQDPFAAAAPAGGVASPPGVGGGGPMAITLAGGAGGAYMPPPPPQQQQHYQQQPPPPAYGAPPPPQQQAYGGGGGGYGAPAPPQQQYGAPPPPQQQQQQQGGYYGAPPPPQGAGQPPPPQQQQQQGAAAAAQPFAAGWA
jgi:replication factor A1